MASSHHSFQHSFLNSIIGLCTIARILAYPPWLLLFLLLYSSFKDKKVFGLLTPLLLNKYLTASSSVLLAQNGHPQADNDKHSLKQSSTIRQILRLKAVHLLALYLLVYVGVEVTLGGVSILLCFPTCPNNY